MAARGQNHGKGKNKQAYAPKPKIPPPPKRENPAKDSICHECREIGHWKRNYPQYLAELMKKKKNTASRAGGSDLDSALLWHCRLGHISKKRIEKLQHDGILDSSVLRAFEKCVSCMSGKIPKKLYTHQVERAKDLLGLIHTDDYALETAARILNMVPTKKVEKTPYEIWHGQAPELSYLKVWGCEALFKRDTLTKPDKLEPKSIKCIFIRYPKEMIGYSFYYPPENKVLVARNAEFLENSLINQEASGSLEDLEIIQEKDMHPSIDTSLNHEEDDLEIDELQSDIVSIRRSIRTRRAPDRMCLYINAEEHELGDLGEPANYKVALLDPYKWLFKKKTNMDGNVHIYKARLMANGYTQTPGIDYEETFSLVADIRAIRILIAIAAYYDYEIWQMDVKTAFLNGYLNKEVYMEQPEGFLNPKYPNREKLKLSKSHGASTPTELKRMQNVPYASAVGSIIRFQHNPDDLHWTTVKNILKYLRNTKDMFLVYEGDLKRELRVSCYTDVVYLTNADDLKSQTGYVFVLNSGAVDWKSAKQSIFATSSAEAEYIAAFDASKEAVWVRKFISGLGVVPTIEELISMYCDNTGVIAIPNESGITKGARHFRAKVHYL
nr:hypothetical protein [Tanacetum cinerariifolium]